MRTVAGMVSALSFVISWLSQSARMSRTIGRTFDPYSSTAQAVAGRLGAVGVDQVEAAYAQGVDGRGHLARDGLRRADVERAVLDLRLVLLLADRRPAPQLPDPVAQDLVMRPVRLAGRLVGVGDEARRVHADRVGCRAQLLGRPLVEFDVGANRVGDPPMMAIMSGSP